MHLQLLLSIVFKVPPDFIMYPQHKWMIIWLHKIAFILLKKLFYKNYMHSFIF